MHNSQKESEKENQIFLAHVQDLAERSRRDNCPYFTSFLNEPQAAEAERIINSFSDLTGILWGGFEQAQRKMYCIQPYFFPKDDIFFPCFCLTFRFLKGYSLSHRDFLGAFMSCGLKRETIGDILIKSGIGQVFVTETAHDTIMREVFKIGKVGVKCSDNEPLLVKAENRMSPIAGTVASLRCDAVVALALHKSRDLVCSMIQQGKVTKNYQPITSQSSLVKKDDILVIHGFGKYRIAEISGVSKKGRIHILIEKYI